MNSVQSRVRLLGQKTFYNDKQYLSELKQAVVNRGQNKIHSDNLSFGISTGACAIVYDNRFGKGEKDPNKPLTIGLISGVSIPSRSIEELEKFLFDNQLNFLDTEDAFVLRRIPQAYWGFPNILVCHSPITVQEDIACQRWLTLHRDISPNLGEKIVLDGTMEKDMVGTIFPRDFFQNPENYILAVGLDN